MNFQMNIKYPLQHFGGRDKIKTSRSNYHSLAAVLGSLAALGTAAGVGSPAGEVVLGRHLAVGHTVNFLHDNWRRGQKENTEEFA